MTTRAPTALDYFTAPPARRARFIAWAGLVATILGGTTAWLFALRGHRILDRDPVLIVGWAALAVAIIAVGILLRTTPPDAVRLEIRASSWCILTCAALLQLFALFALRPVLSHDWVRYRLDGRLWLSGMSPYASTPREFFVRHRSDETDALVSYWELTTIYPATAQAVFVVACVAEEGMVRPQLVPRLFDGAGWRQLVAHRPLWHVGVIQRAIVAVSAVACVWLSIAILTRSRQSPWCAVLLGWSPLFIIEAGGMGHVDIVGVLFVLLTIRSLQSHRPILATALLALAAGVKPHVVLLAPFLLRDAVGAGSRVRARWLAVSFVSFLALVYSPMLYQQGYKGWLRTSHVYATSWEANGSIYDLIKASADPTDGVAVQHAKDRARMIAAAAVVVTMLVAWFGRADFVSAGYWIFLIALLVSPVVYPWYLLWVLCFVPLLRGWQGMTALVWAATVGVSYLLWRTSDWVLPTRWLLVEYVPVYATLMVELAWLVWSRFNRTARPDNLPIAIAS